MAVLNNFSVVLPIHNDDVYLPFSLPSVFALNPNDVVLLFDRCTDESYKIAYQLVDLYGFERQTHFIELPKKLGKNFPLTLVRRRGYALAKNNIILSTATDIILDCNVEKGFKLLSLSPNVAIISLGCFDYPISPRNFLGNIAQKFMMFAKHPRFYGPFWFKRDKWLETNEQAEAQERDAISEDAPLWLSLLQKGKMCHVKSKCIHLRANESFERNYHRGRDYWKVARCGWLFALASSIVMIRPSLAVGYAHARLNEV